MTESTQPDVTALTVQLLSAYLANNTVAATDIPELVRTTKAALVEDAVSVTVKPEDPAYTPAVSVRKSLASNDHIISLIDGKPYKTLKRHLSRHGLTPEAYRERYNLPADYPMVSAGFAAMRREIAEKIGLGRRSATASPPTAASAAATPIEAQPVAIAAETPPSTIETKTTESAATGSGAVGKAKTVARKAARRTETARAPKATTKPASQVTAELAASGEAQGAEKTEPKKRARAGRGTLKLFSAPGETTKNSAPKASKSKAGKSKADASAPPA